jgi:hypothetical protein
MKWFDSRLTFQNLKSSNTVEREMRDKIWIPKLIFCNTDKEHLVGLDDFSTLIVEKNSKFSMFTMNFTVDRYMDKNIGVLLRHLTYCYILWHAENPCVPKTFDANLWSSPNS